MIFAEKHVFVFVPNKNLFVPNVKTEENNNGRQHHMKCQFISKCCVCQKIIGTKIIEADESEMISHGYCDFCFEEKMREIEEMHKVK